MSKLTQLEKLALQDIADDLEVMFKSKIDTEDSVQDFIHKQFKIETDEPKTLGYVTAHLETVDKKLDSLRSRIDLFVDHIMNTK